MALPITGQVSASVPQVRASGSPTALQLQLGEFGFSQILPRHAALTWSSNVFSVSVSAAAAITAYSGGAAGQPQIAVANPSGSGKNLIPLIANFGNAVAASVAGTVEWALWFGLTAAITAGTNATPLNNLTLNKTGSIAAAWTNTALTGSTALTNAVPIGSYYWATAAGASLVTQVATVEFTGYVMIPPGGMMALGGSSALTSATWTGFLAWAETPV